VLQTERERATRHSEECPNEERLVMSGLAADLVADSTNCAD
jgi:hypothetical protein